MLKAIITVKDENDRILDHNKVIYEYNSRPVAFGTAHDFHFCIVTADEDKLKINKSIIEESEKNNERI